METKFTQKTIKTYSYSILHDLEENLFDVFKAGVISDWSVMWAPVIDENTKKKIEQTAEKNKRSPGWDNIDLFIQNMTLPDSIFLVLQLSKKGNLYFQRLIPEPKKDQITLERLSGEISRFRNLVDHPGGKTVYLRDIETFLGAAIVICNILALSVLGNKLAKIRRDIESSIIESDFFSSDGYEEVYNNMPTPDYEEWSGLVGRKEIKSEIIADLDRGHNRIIAITGGGGIGKSALAMSIAFEYLKPSNYQFRHIIWVTSKNNYLDSSGIKSLKPNYLYTNNFKDFLNQIISGFYTKLYTANLDEITELQLETEVIEILNTYDRILFIVDNLENIDDVKILEFIKNKILPPNYVLITSRVGLGEINKTYKLEPLDNQSAELLFQNLAKYYQIELDKVDKKKIFQLLQKTNNYPLVIKWCLSLVSDRRMELEQAFFELSKPKNSLLEFIFEKLYKQLSSTSKKILKTLAVYKEIPDRNIIAFIAGIETEDELGDSIYQLEQHSLISQKRIDSKEGIIETINLLGLAETFLNNPLVFDEKQRKLLEETIVEIENELDNMTVEINKDYRPAQRLAQSKLLKAFQLSALHSKIHQKKIDKYIQDAIRLAPRFYLIPFHQALIEINNIDYNYTNVKRLFDETLQLNPQFARCYFEYGNLIKRHEPTSFKKYSNLFKTAFKVDKKIGYGIFAGQGLFSQGDYEGANAIVREIMEIDPTFPKDNQNRLWVASSIVQFYESKVINEPSLVIEKLKNIESIIEKNRTEKLENYRLLEARYCSILSTCYLFINENTLARTFLDSSSKILNEYKSTKRDKAELRIPLCFNMFVDCGLTDNEQAKINSSNKFEREINSFSDLKLKTFFLPYLKNLKRKLS